METERDYIAERDLNARIAEEVLGLKVHKNIKGGWSIGEPDYYDSYGEMILFNPLPNYSNDIKDAWEVVEKLSFLGSGFDLHAEFCGELGMDGYEAKFGDFSRHGWFGTAYAETAPMAICQAALIAIERLK